MASSNRLALESSPYLRQHADNPVDWHPWGAEALDRAHSENKPILLSIGYSACHWCHVMAHESFEDAETAALMNKHFVNIKVDREERPDLDKIYQLAHSALTQRSGGWPLTLFLTPDQVPYFAGTYFPNKPRYGMPAFKDVLLRVAEYLHEKPDEISRQNKSLLAFFRSIEDDPGHDPAGVSALIDNCIESLKQGFDPVSGGFGGAPKFPQTSLLELALKLGRQYDDKQLTQITQFSLQKMITSGLYDQLGGGFFRYSVDAEWTIPHFEKMLYDNGQLLYVLALAWRTKPSLLLERAISETIQWLQREMMADSGGFYAALDADSEGEEGKYYVWTTDEIKAILEPQAYALIAGSLGLDRENNFEGRWHLQLNRDPVDLATELDMHTNAALQLFTQSREQLLAERQKRIGPQRDDKILCSWNALTIKSIAAAGLLLEKPEFILIAERAMQDVQKKFRHNSRLLAAHCDGQSRFNAYLDDYAFLLDASLLLLETKWNSDVLAFAQELAAALLTHFYDRNQNKFYFTADDHEALIHRPHSLMDESTPAGAVVAANSLLKLGYLLANPEYISTAVNCIENMIPSVSRSPLAHGGALRAILDLQKPDAQIILRGDAEELKAWQQYARKICSPWTSIYAIGTDQPLPESLTSKETAGNCVAYICYAGTCKTAIGEFEEFKKAVQELFA